MNDLSHQNEHNVDIIERLPPNLWLLVYSCSSAVAVIAFMAEDVFRNHQGKEVGLYLLAVAFITMVWPVPIDKPEPGRRIAYYIAESNWTAPIQSALTHILPIMVTGLVWVFIGHNENATFPLTTGSLISVALVHLIITVQHRMTQPNV